MPTRAWTILVTGAVLIGAGTLGAANAQPSTLMVPGVIEGDLVDGRIARADPATRTITLDNGQEYLVPWTLALNWGLVQPGVAVKVRYSVDAGRNIATALTFRP